MVHFKSLAMKKLLVIGILQACAVYASDQSPARQIMVAGNTFQITAETTGRQLEESVLAKSSDAVQQGVIRTKSDIRARVLPQLSIGKKTWLCCFPATMWYSLDAELPVAAAMDYHASALFAKRRGFKDHQSQRPYTQSCKETYCECRICYLERCRNVTRCEIASRCSLNCALYSCSCGCCCRSGSGDFNSDGSSDDDEDQALNEEFSVS